MFEQIKEDTLFCMFYASVAMLSLTACCYLLFRQGNAFAPDIKTPASLRRWTAAFFASLTLSHLWYLPIIYLSSSEDVKMYILVGALLDYMTVFPLAIGVLFAMLQDRRRPSWTIAVMDAPLIAILVWCIASRSDAPLPLFYTYLLLLGIGFVIYMAYAVKHYGHWLRDNYADLEHKEIWQSFVVLAIFLLFFIIYSFVLNGPIYRYAMQMNEIILISYLLWRVETLSELNIPIDNNVEEEMNMSESKVLSQSIYFRIETLLKQNCEEPKLYLQHDLSVSQLAKLLGTNRVYISKYFAMQGITYNTYINGLRIQHFISLHQEAVATRQPITVQELAHKSGFRNYGTFNTAFKQSMGMTATEWMQTSIL